MFRSHQYGSKAPRAQFDDAVQMNFMQEQTQALIEAQTNLLAETMIQPFVDEVDICSGESPIEYWTWRQAISRLEYELTGPLLMKVIRRTLSEPALDVFLALYHATKSKSILGQM